jgi:hypothetical protein
VATNRLVTIGTLSERTEVNIETIPYYERIGICPSLPGVRADTGSMPKNISGAWSSSDGHANWVFPLMMCAPSYDCRAQPNTGTGTGTGGSLASPHRGDLARNEGLKHDSWRLVARAALA